MKKRSIGLTLKIRYWSSIAYYISILCYGILVVNFYGISNLTGKTGFVILLSYIIALLCLMIKAETFMKYCDPLNIGNRKKYMLICTLEFSEMIIAAVLAQVNNENRKDILQVGFIFISTMILICSIYLHKSIIKNYEEIRGCEILNEKMKYYLEAVQCDKTVDVDRLFKSFCGFIIYIILLTFIYKYTLKYWISTFVFMAFNIFVLWKLHWSGIKELVKSKYVYFAVVSVISSLGIVLLKLIYDKAIVLSIFQNRDEQEYLMILVLFFLPLIYYGSKLSMAYMNNKNQWVE